MAKAKSTRATAAPSRGSGFLRIPEESMDDALCRLDNLRGAIEEVSIHSLQSSDVDTARGGQILCVARREMRQLQDDLEEMMRVARIVEVANG